MAGANVKSVKRKICKTVYLCTMQVALVEVLNYNEIIKNGIICH